MLIKEALCIALALAALGACSGDDDNSKRDSSAPEASVSEAGVDTQQPFDSSQMDSGTHSDGSAGQCDEDSDCTEPYAPRCDPATKSCVECFDHAQCANATNGSRCVDGICSCESAADCTADEVWGSRCVELEMMGYTFHMCGCESGADCGESRYGPQCYTGMNQCSCLDNSECSEPRGACARPASITDYAFCQAPCTKDGDCVGRWALTICDTLSGACVECLRPEDCAQSPFGEVCAMDEGVLSGSCVCNTVADCPSGKSCALDAFGLMSCQ